MSRALLPVGAVAGLWACLVRWREELGLEVSPGLLVRYISQSVASSFLEDTANRVVWQELLQVGAFLIVLQSRRELSFLFTCLLEIFFQILSVFHILLGRLLHLLVLCSSFWGRPGSSLSWQRQSPERGVDLTWQDMAAAAAAAPLPTGTFVLISRPPEWDEVFVAGFGQGGTEALCRTTTSDGTDWAWVLVQIVGLHMRLPAVAADGSRMAPQGVDGNAVNWICLPPAGNTQWAPGAGEVVNVTTEAGLILAQFNGGNTHWPVNIPGVGGPLVAINAVLGGPVAPGGVGVAAGVANAPVGGGQGLAAGSGQPNQSNIQALEAAVQQLQAMALSPASSQKLSKKKKKKKSKKDRKEKKRKKSSSSSSTSNSSRSRSKSSGSSSSGKKSRPLRWKDSGRDRKVGQADLTHIDMTKFKKRGDLVAFAARHPGALTAHFLASVYSRLSKGTITRSSQLREASVTSWAHQFAGLSEIRDMKEVLTLAEVLDAVNRKEIAQAMDILCQRILAIQAAKQKGGSWEKAEAIELVDNRKTLASSALLALTNS